MRGLGRNIKFMTEYCFQLLIKSYLLLLFIWVIFGKMKDGIGPFIREEAPFFLPSFSPPLILSQHTILCISTTSFSLPHSSENHCGDSAPRL